MRNRILVVLFVALFALPVRSQTETRLDQCPAAFRAFYGRFVAAVRRTDKAAVAAMTRFPLQWGFDAGDEGTYTRAQFIRNFSRLFGRSTRDFMRERNPMCSKSGDGTVDVSSEDALHLIFSSYRSGYRLTAYIVEP